MVTGPTGSGKSTTLAAMVDHKNETEYGHILTIEDPIEFVHQSKKCLITKEKCTEIRWVLMKLCARRSGRTQMLFWLAR